MTRTVISIIAAVLLVFLGLPADAVAGPPRDLPPTTPDFSPREVVVRFELGTTHREMATIHHNAGARLAASIPALGVQVVTVPAGTVGQSIRRYTTNPLVLYAEPNYIAEVLAEPDDPYFDRQWGLHKVEAAAAWDVTTGSPEVVIAILDTGVDTDHPDLVDKIVESINFSDSDTADDVHGHGTHVAGIAAASTNNAIGVAGLGYDSSLMNVKVLGDSGSGYYSWIAAGITWAADNGAHVINLSLGGTSGSQLLEDAVNYAWSKGVVVVAAAGNSGTSSPFYPAYYANCMAVAATDRYDSKASWSNYGSWVDVAAPGASIYATLRNGVYGHKSGTSMASPHVAGLAALVFTVVTDENGNGHVNDEVRARIESTCDDIGVEGIGAGRINAARAVGAYDAEPEPEPDVQIALSANPATVSEAGEVITYTYTVTNTGLVTLAGVTVTDDFLGNISLPATTVAPGASTSGTATYTISQDDIDAGTPIVNIATVTTNEGVSDSDIVTVTIAQQPDVQIVLTADPTSVSDAGTEVTYTYTVSNTGKITLTGIVVYDDLLGDISLAAATLAPGATTASMAPYTVDQADIDVGTPIVNIATATTNEGATDSDSVTVTIAQQPDVQIVLTADPTSVSDAGTEVTYTYTVSNTGKISLTGITVFDDLLGDISLAATTLAPGATTASMATYTITQADIDSGTDIVSTATATTDQGVADSDIATVSIEVPEVARVTISATDSSERGWPGEDVVYEFTVENTGNVQDTYDISATSTWASSVAPQILALEPGAAATVTVTHTVPAGVSPGEFDAGTIEVLSGETAASAWATFATTARVSAVEISPGEQIATAAPGETIEYTYTVANTGTEDETYDFMVSANWDASLSATSVSVKAGQSIAVVVSHTILEGAEGGNSDTGALTATSERVSASAIFTTTAEEEEEPAAPVIDLFKVINTSNRIWTRVTVDWAVSHEDGALATVQILITLDGSIIDSAVFSASGYDASGSYQWRNRGGHGKTYEIVLIVTDRDGNSTSRTESIYL